MSLYSSSRSLVNLYASKGKESARGEISADLRHYLADEAMFHGALAHKWLGVDAGENGGNSKGGEAVGFLIWAKKELEEMKDGSKGIGMGEEKKKKERRRGKVVEELEKATVFLKHYQKLNDSVRFSPPSRFPSS